MEMIIFYIIAILLARYEDNRDVKAGQQETENGYDVDNMAVLHRSVMGKHVSRKIL